MENNGNGSYGGRSAKFWFDALAAYVDQDAALSDYGRCADILRSIGLTENDLEVMGLGEFTVRMPGSVLFRYTGGNIAIIPFKEEYEAVKEVTSGYYTPLEADEWRVERNGCTAEAYALYSNLQDSVDLYAARVTKELFDSEKSCLVVMADENEEKIDVETYKDYSEARSALIDEFDTKCAELRYPLSSINEEGTYALTEDEDGWKYCWRLIRQRDILASAASGGEE